MNQFTTNMWSEGYDLPVPFQVPLEDGQVLICEEVVRAMPGRRYVCRGTYNGEAVYAKLFSISNKATREWKSEQTGIDSLNAAGVLAPNIIESVVLEQVELQLIIYTEIANAENARLKWDVGDESDRKMLIISLLKVLASHHNANLIQQDLHLANFMCRGEEVFTLDASDIAKKVISYDIAIESLSGLFALLNSKYDAWIPALSKHYFSLRGMPFSDLDILALEKGVLKSRCYKRRKYLKKIFRSCSAFVSKKSWRRRIVYDRKNESVAFSKFCDNPDNSADSVSKTVLKDGNTCLVTQLTFAQQRLVIKRYNIKNFWHGVGRAFRETRASKSWRNAHRLLHCGILTPKPIAFVENRFGPIRHNAWFIMEFTDGDSARKYFHDTSITDSQLREIAVQFAQFFGVMKREGFSHGDMKATNFIIHDEQLYVIDLDAMQAHEDKNSHFRALQRDAARFMKNWESLPAVGSLFCEVFTAEGLSDYLPLEPTS